MKPYSRLIAALVSAATMFAAQADAGQLDELDAELKKTWPNNRAINIVFHGHSVPSGYFVTPQVNTFESYPHLFHMDLKKRYPNAVINVIITAIGGENSIQGAARFQADVFRHKPDLIFIDYALNDRLEDPAQVDAAWRSMITAAKNAKVPLILCTPTGDKTEDLSKPTNRLRILADMIRGLAAKEDVMLADVSEAWVAKRSSQDRLHSMDNHPNAAGHRVAADAIFKTFETATTGR
jgi:acyl-CoA thioesterase I